MTAQALVVLDAENTAVSETIQLLEQLADLAPEVLKALLGVIENAPISGSLNVEGELAQGTREFRVRLQLPDPLPDLMPTLRALDRDFNVVKRALIEHSALPSKTAGR